MKQPIPSKPKITAGSAGGGFSDLLGWPTNPQGQQTEELPDPLIYGYQKGGTVQTPGNLFRRKMALMRGYQGGGNVDDPKGRPAWAGPLSTAGGQPSGNLPPGLQGTLPPGLANRDSLPPGLANFGNRPGQPDQSNVPTTPMPPQPNPMDYGRGFDPIRRPAPTAPTPRPWATQGYAKGGAIQPLNPANKGKFTASAKAAGKGVQGFASEVLSAPKGQYSSTQRKRANFARNAAGWSHK